MKVGEYFLIYMLSGLAVLHVSYAEIPKLYYFDIPGKAEAIRLAATHGGFLFEDVRLNRNEFDSLKSNGTLKFGQVPVLKVAEDQYISQSATIIRYIGKQTGLYPSNDIIAALVDSIIDQEVDMFTGLTVSKYPDRFGFGAITTNQKLVFSIRESVLADVIPRHLGYFETILSKSTTMWIANTTNPTIADFVLVPRLIAVREFVEDELQFDVLYSFPRLRSLIENILTLPAVQCYYDKEKKQCFNNV